MTADPDFWELSSVDDTDVLADWDRSVQLGGPIKCRLNPGHQRAGKRVSELAVVLPSLSPKDFVWTWMSECLIQDHVLDLFRAEGVTGFEARRARARFRDEPAIRPPGLWELVVTGWGGVAPEESGVRLDEKESCGACGLLTYSNFINPSRLLDRSQWDGSDIFLVWPLPKLIFVTQRVARLIQSHELRGAILQRPEELQPSVKTVSPGRLSYRMPEARARELGEHLGIA
jgi:hypothetical protein